MAILSNKLNGPVVIHTVANSTLTIAGNNSVSNVATSTEVLTGAVVKKVMYGSDAGHWSIKRGANTILVLTGTGVMDFASINSPISVDSTGTLVMTLNGSANGFLVVELSKQGNFTRTY